MVGILSYLSTIGNPDKMKLDKQVSAGRKELFKIMRRQDAKRSDVEPIMAKLDDTFSAMDRDFLDWRFRVKDIATSAEWAEIVAAARPEAVNDFPASCHVRCTLGPGDHFGIGRTARRNVGRLQRRLAGSGPPAVLLPEAAGRAISWRVPIQDS